MLRRLLSAAIAAAAIGFTAQGIGCAFSRAGVGPDGIDANGPGNVLRADAAASARTEAPAGTLTLTDGESRLTTAQPGGTSGFWIQTPDGYDIWGAPTGDVRLTGLDITTADDGKTRIKAETVESLASPIVRESTQYVEKAREIWTGLSADDRDKTRAALDALKAISPPLFDALRAILGGAL